MDGEKVLSPFGSFQFLERREELLTRIFSGQELNSKPVGLLMAMQSLVTNLIKGSLTHAFCALHFLLFIEKLGVGDLIVCLGQQNTAKNTSKCSNQFLDKAVQVSFTRTHNAHLQYC